MRQACLRGRMQFSSIMTIVQTFNRGCLHTPRHWSQHFSRNVTLLTRVDTKSSLSTPERLCQIMVQYHGCTWKRKDAACRFCGPSPAVCNSRIPRANQDEQNQSPRLSTQKPQQKQACGQHQGRHALTRATIPDNARQGR